MKQKTYRTLKSKAYGEQKTATVEAQKGLARGLKEELEQAMPELKGLNQAEGEMIDLQGILEKAIKRTGNRNLIDAIDMWTAGRGIAEAAGGAMIGHPVVGAAAAGIEASIGLLRWALKNPKVATKLAIGLQKGSARMGAPITIGQAQGRVNTYINALAQGTRQERDRSNSDQARTPEPAMQPAR
mgnify:CR=1 FL=1